eukprot:TRINITY_DN17640_c0_g1_i1.p1 TRINITY_DN17640_c0_g1~~TRINITY_DN17640_c0_g1_i1.p1  ORF type:complete len:464 (+),score=104.47 TRINITY_DN17640_c0_g1_i1:132-1523(+)
MLAFNISLILSCLFVCVVSVQGLGYCDSAKLACKEGWVTSRPGRVIKRWLDKIRNVPDCFVVPFRDVAKLGKYPLGGGKPDGMGTESWEGEVDVDGYFEGEGVLNVADCSGQDGCLENLERVEGLWFGGRLEGVAYFFTKERVETVNMVHGLRHGIGLGFGDNEKKYLVWATMYKDGEEIGPVWDLTMGQGLDRKQQYQPRTQSVMGHLTPLDFLGGGVLYNNSVWLHPDMETVMVGKWKKGVMEEGNEGKVRAVRCNNGILELEVKPAGTSKIFKYDPPTATMMTSEPQERDPYESKHLVVKKSRLGGDGLFARLDTPKNTLLAYYSGFKIPVNSLEDIWVGEVGGEDIAESLNSEDSKVKELIERKSYLIALDPEHDIDMPPEIGLDSSKYVATLGHKTNHWFSPNCYFGWAVHPRHGRIRSVVSLRAISAGEELTVDYDYPPLEKYTPKWYKKLYKFMYK